MHLHTHISYIVMQSANRILNLVDINDYIIGTFMYKYMHGNVTDIFNNFSKK